MAYLMILFIISQSNASNSGGFVGYQIMYLTPDFITLNQAFHSGGQDSITFRGGIYTQGIGGYAAPGGILLGGFGFKGSMVNETDSISIKSDYSGGFFELGISLFKSRLFSVYPLLGIGTSNVKLNLKTIRKDETFRDVINTPGRSSTIKTGGLTIEPGVIFQLWIKNKRSQPISIFIKVSYFYLPKKANWTFGDGAEVLGGPDFRPGGLAVTSGISLGGSS